MMMRSFSPCSDLQTRQVIWAMYSNGQYLGFSSASLIANQYAKKYADDVKVRSFN